MSRAHPLNDHPRAVGQYLQDSRFGHAFQNPVIQRFRILQLGQGQYAVLVRLMNYDQYSDAFI